LSQPLSLLGPIRLDSVTLGANSAIYSASSSARVDFTTRLTVSATVIITAPVNFYVTTPNPSQFTLTFNPPIVPAVLTLTPTLSNPLNLPVPTQFIFSVVKLATVRFFANSTLAFNGVQVTGAGTVRFSGPSTYTLSGTSGTLLVQPGATFWADGASITATNATFAPPASSSSAPSNLEVTVNSYAPPIISATYAVYGGAAIVYLSNYAPTSPQNVTFVNGTTSASGNFLNPVTGSTGFTYSGYRSGTNFAVTITPTPPPTPAPTQSDGPSPFSSASSKQISLFLVFVGFVFAISSLF